MVREIFLIRGQMAYYPRNSLFEKTQGYFLLKEKREIRGVSFLMMDVILKLGGYGKSVHIRFDSEKTITSVTIGDKTGITRAKEWEGRTLFHLLVMLNAWIDANPSRYFDLFSEIPDLSSFLKTVLPEPTSRSFDGKGRVHLDIYEDSVIRVSSFKDRCCWVWRKDRDLFYLAVFLSLPGVAFYTFIKELHGKWSSEPFEYPACIRDDLSGSGEPNLGSGRTNTSESKEYPDPASLESNLPSFQKERPIRLLTRSPVVPKKEPIVRLLVRKPSEISLEKTTPPPEKNKTVWAVIGITYQKYDQNLIQKVLESANQLSKNPDPEILLQIRVRLECAPVFFAEKILRIFSSHEEAELFSNSKECSGYNSISIRSWDL